MKLTQEEYDKFEQKIHAAISEADVRRAWDHLITDVLGESIHEEQEYRDMTISNVVIEFKDKGMFKNSKESPKFKEATKGRIFKYINRLSKKSNMPTSAFIGVVTDGQCTSIVTVENGKVDSGNLLSVNFNNIEYVLRVIDKGMRVPLTSSNLIDDFGPLSKYGGPVILSMYSALNADLQQKGNNKTKLFFNEWKNLYGQVSTMPKNKREVVLKELGFPLDAGLSEVLFTINTYNSFLVKLLAAELISTLPISSYSKFSETIGLTSKNIFTVLKSELELDNFFESSNIHNFVSEVLFSWYTESTNKPSNMAEKVRAICLRLSLYDISNYQAMRSGDLLKDFYQKLVPDKLRKSLGEFYTPDWLVSYMLNKLGSLEDKTILDPTNGSGSFLLQAIYKKKEIYQRKGLGSQEQLSKILSEVYGFDLNPLAVQIARVNYLFAIYDLIIDSPGITVEIPVLLSDAIYVPEMQQGTDKYVYTIGSNVADLHVELPKSLVDSRQRLVKTFSILNAAIDHNGKFEDCLPSLQALFTNEDASFFKTLNNTFDKVQDLHKKSWDGIWFQIIQNFFWSIELPKMDIIVGNPPWVRWSSLPELYRERVKDTAKLYDIFSEHKRYGGNELDISALVTVSVADRWLKNNGVISFLLPQIHLQNDSSSGFRQFKIGKYHLIPQIIEDLQNISAFENVVNKPMIITLKKGTNDPTFPVEYKKWISVDNKKVVKNNAALSDVLMTRDVRDLLAKPLKDSPRARWIYGTRQQLPIFDKLLGQPTYHGRKGITTDLNGIFFPRILNQGNGLVQIETRPSAGRVNIGPAFRTWVEQDMIYPLAKGSRNIKRGEFVSDDSIVAIVPNKGIQDRDYKDAQKQMEKLPKMKAYFERFEAVLRNRSTYRNFMKGAPYWSVYNVGNYTFSPYKVSWSEIGSKVNAALLEEPVSKLKNKIVIPDHKLFFVPFKDRDSAMYLMGILNSSIIGDIVTNSTVSTSRGDILKDLHLPLYDKINPNHQALVSYLKSASDVDQKEIDRLIKKIL
ncbi:N-6 DNA methylase [Limosilactobacillus balticus]|uniref:N-6 DNA methylase n=1 Tax=Limosilactobacillus balticus TaxID=2759747 RepID=UPI003993A594